jgi:actin related protein 2/3 complex subunit 1A/1B|mmetsp:Transcript_23089/g.32573  ORF Transcript_23089/g.32573 Transcript_23089/m.32573 type:complete len:362 (-) Transcript_23089:157-1242(-)|eukprot:CAMPEP_0175097494 /NCGR_PEP_ID=MMETSP0086_2-20121207/5316_1 /TAXON_ID=136419 /ORGANISM="Unknown Unknown, Strain D1" /LENGTH=361 /DNA_ID=CAMNT_0016371007 /DNA_START=22 /DNA_END=1107 /DNA_ORIENTATION=+
MSKAPLVNGLQTASYHAFNKDGNLCAVASNDDNVTIFESKDSDCGKWKKTEHVLDEHGGYISGIDWHAGTNQIVTCGHDRNAYVWNYDAKAMKWKPSLVILRINRAATAVKWSPDGKKFAVTSGTKCVPICKFDKEHDWWGCDQIKKHKSTVLAVDWSPNGKFVVTGACDFKCRIISAFVAELDDATNDYPQWPKANEFGEVLAEFDQAKAWVQSVSWSPNGQSVAFAGHGSTLHFANLSDNSVSTYYSKALPFNHIDFVSDTAAVATGYDLNPTLFNKQGDAWDVVKQLDENKKEEAKVATGGAAAARAMFGAMANRGQTKTEASSINTKHTNVITDVKVVSANEITTCSIDGRIIRWKF